MKTSEVNITAICAEAQEMVNLLDKVKAFSRREDVLAAAIFFDSKKKTANTAEEDKVSGIASAVSTVKIKLEQFEMNLDKLKRRLERQAEAE